MPLPIDRLLNDHDLLLGQSVQLGDDPGVQQRVLVVAGEQIALSLVDLVPLSHDTCRLRVAAPVVEVLVGEEDGIEVWPPNVSPGSY